MSSPPPIKPPRGVKQGKETSGLLMSVIRTLSASETNDQRDQEKAKLEKEYKKSDQKLDELVSRHSNEVTQVMQVFGTAWTIVGGCRERVRAARARLAACGNLLRVRRADLRRLWADSRQHKHALDMLTQIEHLVSVDKEVAKYLSQCHFLNAATILQSALNIANTNLAEVEALQHLRMDLENKKQSLVEGITVSLSESIYKTDIDSLGFKRQGSSRDRLQAEAIPMKLAELRKYESLSDDHIQDITTEFELTLTEEDRTMKLNMAILVESLAVLDKITETTENLKVQIQNELLQIIATISQQVIDYGSTQFPIINGPSAQNAPDIVISDKDDDEIDPQYQLIVELLTSILEHFKTVAQRQSVLLGIWENTIIKHKVENIKLYSMHHYWSQVQSMLQLLLTDYLDIQNLSLSTQRTNFTDQPANMDINFYFMKKKSQTKRKVRLFKFRNADAAAAECEAENSSPVSVVPSESRGKTYQLVSRPKPDNLPHIYHILEAFMNEIELNTGRGECSLRVFISDYIKTTEVERLANDIQNAFDMAVSEPGAWRELIVAPVLDNRLNGGLIFKCCVQAWLGVYKAVRSVRRLRAHGDYVIRSTTIPSLPGLLMKARSATNHMAGTPTMVAPTASPGRAPTGTPTPAPRISRASARSSAWLADDDIIRFLKSLPNWTALKTPPSKKKRSVHHQILDQDMKQSYEREAEILGSSLGDGTVQHKEIISSSNTLKDIAVMCESMDWLSASIKALSTQLSGNATGQIPNGLTGTSGHIKLSDRTVNELSNSAAGFEELSDICLLLLHLELRIQCFHYLSQDDENAKVRGSTPLLTESGAIRLATTIQTFYEDTLPILQMPKMNYIFHGLGEMMSAAILSRCHESLAPGGASNSAVSSPMGTPVRTIGSSSSNGPHAQRLASLRHCLAAIGQPPDGLHRAALYLEMLTMSPDEILRSVSEKGPMFSDLEYLNAFNIIGRSRNQSVAEIKVYLTKLSNILGNVGVTV